MTETQDADVSELGGTYAMLKGERIADGVYTLYGLPAGDGGDFRDADEWHEIQASMLKVNGVGFSAEAFEFSEHKTDIELSFETPGGTAYIEW